MLNTCATNLKIIVNVSSIAYLFLKCFTIIVQSLFVVLLPNSLGAEHYNPATPHLTPSRRSKEDRVHDPAELWTGRSCPAFVQRIGCGNLEREVGRKRLY